jgi:hypothetical protein
MPAQTTELKPVPGTNGLLAVRRHQAWFRLPNENWDLVHVPTDRNAGIFRTAKDARDVARQVYAAAPEAWALRDEHAVVDALPACTGAWLWFLMKAQRGSPYPPVASLTPLAQFLAEASPAPAEGK